MGRLGKGCSINSCTSSKRLPNYQGMSFAVRSFFSLDITGTCIVMPFEGKEIVEKRYSKKSIEIQLGLVWIVIYGAVKVHKD